MRYVSKRSYSSRVVVNKNSEPKKATIAVLEELDLPDLNGKNILLKPNVGRDLINYKGINTNPKVVEAIFEYLKERYDAKFFLGDSPIIGVNTRQAFIHAGYKGLIENKDITYLDLDDKKPINIEIPNGKIIKSIKVSGYINDFDYIISIAVLKMHMHTGASLSMKNCKGLIYRREKVKLHHLNNQELIKSFNFPIKELDIAISDYGSVVHPDLAIIDATTAQEGMGPSDGNPVNLDLVIGSTDYLAADRVALSIVQPSWNLKNVPHLWLLANESGRADKLNNLEDIELIPSDISKFIHEIKQPPKEISIKYPNVTLIDLESCSGCLSTVFLFLKNNQEFINKYFTQENPLNLAIGKGLKNTQFYEPTFLVGNCTANRKNDGIFIKGCTPVQSKIKQTVIEYLKNEGLLKPEDEEK